jgi:hypothetical protein
MAGCGNNAGHTEINSADIDCNESKRYREDQANYEN